jgi:quercetin dioxygenase-like cupin family protein
MVRFVVPRPHFLASRRMGGTVIATGKPLAVPFSLYTMQYYERPITIRPRQSDASVEDTMRPTTIALALGTAALCTMAAAQNAPAPSATRTVVAATKLPVSADKPLSFRATSIAIAPAQKDTFSGADGILYQVSGSTEVSVGAASKTLAPGEGMFIPAGVPATLTARGGEPSSLLHFVLAPAATPDQLAASAAVKELYRTLQPIPGLKAGTHDLNLTRVTFPAQMPSNPPHHRSGGALYYVVSGTGANTVEGKIEARPPGTFIYEPSGLVHQWGNPGDAPLTFLVFNINQEGVAAVVADTPPKNQ